MSAKSGFKRFISVILSFAIAFSTFADLLPSSIVFAADDDSGMHIIIQHWHTEEAGGLKSSDVTLTSDVYVDNGEIPPVVSAAKGELTFNALPDTALETFAGFAVSAGNDCVKLNPTVATLTVKYDSNVHLVKVNVFYSAKPKLVPGTEMTVGTEDVTGKYKDTEWAEIDTELQEKIVAAIGEDRFDELLTGDIGDQYIKLYNTSEGLHTDKTATAVYNDDKNNKGTTSEDKTGDGTRVFDINLEAWYNDQATAKVGLILDASGSMAFISDGLEPMKLEYDDKAYTYKYEDKVTGEVKEISGVSKNQYLTPEQVNQILDTNLTDNSKLSYSDYSYYIYDTRDFTQEFVPLAYWGGNNKEEDGKVITLETAGEGFLKHWNIEDDNRDKEYYIVNRDGSGPYKKDESLETVERKTTTRDTETNNKAIRLISYFNDSNGSGHAGYYMALDDSSLPKDESFTVTFAVQCKSNTQGPLLSIGPKTATASNEGYLFAVDDNRLTVKDKGGFTIVQIYNAFSKSINASGEGYNYFTFVFDNNKLYLYLNGELIADKNTNPDDYSSMVYNNYSQGKKYTSLGVYGSELQAVIGGFWSDVSHYSEDTKRTLNIDDIVLYDSALDAEHVEQMYNVLVGNSSTAVSTNTKAYDDSGDNIIATYKAALNEGSQADRAGWYFVNSGSDLTNFYETVGTAKELCGLPAGEVIYNYIDYEKLPLTEKVIASLKAAKAEDGNGGYIATSGKDFTGSGYLWNGDESATEITVGDAEHDCAITVPKGENRQYISGGYSPCVFFIDDAGYLRCFYNNGGNTHTVDSKGNDKFTDELRSGVSYVYQKDDETNIKTEDLQYALGQFAAQLHNATPNSMISAVRFSNQKIAKDYKDGVPKVGIEGVTANYEKDILKKFVMLDWTSDTKEISQILSLERGDGGMTDTGSEKSTLAEGLADGIDLLDQYNYGMTGGTYTWTGFQAYTDFLDNRLKEDDLSKKYIILFTDGMDNTLEKDGDEARDYAIKLAKTLKEDKDYTIFCVVLKNKSFETSGRAEKVQEYMAEIAGNKSTDNNKYESNAKNMKLCRQKIRQQGISLRLMTLKA